MSIQSDIDIDFGDRTKLLKLIKHVPAAMREVDPIKKHPTGVYITDVPYDPVNDMCNFLLKFSICSQQMQLSIINSQFGTFEFMTLTNISNIVFS